MHPPRPRLTHALSGTLAAAILAAACLAPISTAQQPTDPPRQSPQRAQPQSTGTPSPNNAPRFDLRFNGGTVAQYLEAIQLASGTRNIVAMPGLDRVPMPPVHLDQVSTAAAVAVAERVIHSETPGTTTYLSASVTDGVFTVTRDDRPNQLRPGQIPFPPGTTVHGLAALLDDPLGSAYSVNAILSALEAALDLSDQPSAKLRFHEETRTLFVHATAPDQQVVSAVLDALRDQLVAMRAVQSPLQRNRQALADAIELKHREEAATRAWRESIDHAEIAIDRIRSTIHQLNEQTAQGNANTATEHELALQFRALERAQIELETAQREHRNAQSRLQAANAQWQRLQKYGQDNPTETTEQQHDDPTDPSHADQPDPAEDPSDDPDNSR